MATICRRSGIGSGRIEWRVFINHKGTKNTKKTWALLFLAFFVFFVPLWLNRFFYLPGCSTSFCTRQFNNSATYNTFSEGHASS